MVQLTDARIKELIRRYKPRGWKLKHPVKYDIDLQGLCDWDTRTISCPTLHDLGPDTALRFCIFFHECAHAHLGHCEITIPRHVEEYEAERYSFLIALAEGFHIDASIVEAAQHNVRSAIGEDEKREQKISDFIRVWTARPHYPAIYQMAMP